MFEVHCIDKVPLWHQIINKTNYFFRYNLAQDKRRKSLFNLLLFVPLLLIEPPRNVGDESAAVVVQSYKQTKTISTIIHFISN